METFRTSFSTATRRLDADAYPMKLFRKAKKLGTWDPALFDLSQDKADWHRLDERQRDLVLRLTAQFVAGEESVTYDLLPLLQVMAAQGRIEDEMFLTSYLWEEAKHVEAFGRFIAEVTGAEGALDGFFSEAYQMLFYEALPTAMDRLRTDHSPEALADAVVTYQMIVEGVLAETGYHAYYTIMERAGIMPGLRQMVERIQRDEARHVGYGVYLLARLVAEHGDTMWHRIEAKMNTLIPVALQIVPESLASYGDDIPFGIEMQEFLDFGMAQFQKRYARIEKARRQSLGEIAGAEG